MPPQRRSHRRRRLAGLIGHDNIAIAAKLPDALSAGANVGSSTARCSSLQRISFPVSTGSICRATPATVSGSGRWAGPVSLQQSVIDAASAELD